MRRWLPWVLLACVPSTAVLAAKPAVLQAPGGSYNLQLTSLKEARYRNTIHQKYDFSCGSAAVATLLTYQYNYPVDEQTAFEQMYANGDQAKIKKEGFSLLDLKRFLQDNGFDADGFDVSLDKLRQDGLPAIVLINENGYHHFVVIKGLTDKRVLIGDPAKGTRSMPRSEFQQLWKSRLVFVIHNRRNLAIFNSNDDWRVAPSAPLGSGLDRRGLETVVIPRRGPGDI